MHLKNTQVFVMWDSYISGQKSKKYYKELDIVKKSSWNFKKYERNAHGYLQFLKDMQLLFKNVKWKDVEKTLAKATDEYNYVTTLAKAIDEYNYVTITLPIQNMEKARDKVKNQINNLR